MSEYLTFDPAKTAEALAWCADSTDQADFLNELGRALQSWETHAVYSSLRMQLAKVARKLDGCGAMFIEVMARALDDLANEKNTAELKTPEIDE